MNAVSHNDQEILYHHQRQDLMLVYDLEVHNTWAWPVID